MKIITDAEIEIVLEVVELLYTGENNHGCIGDSVKINPVTARIGIIESGRCCTAACHGYPNYDLPAGLKINQEVYLPQGITWEKAEELKNIIPRDISCQDQTMVTPYDLLDDNQPEGDSKQEEGKMIYKIFKAMK